MARSHGVIKVEVWEPRSDFRRLGIDGQWAYTMLISQPQINNLGILPYVPEKWARLAEDLDRERLDQALAALEHDRYTITDTDTGELLVRTFIRHDAVWKQPRLVTNARRLYRELESQTIADHLADRHPWLVEDGWSPEKIAKHENRKPRRETPSETPLDTPSETPLAKPGENTSEKPLSEGVSPLRAHAQDGLGLPLGLPHLASKAAAETSARETTNEPAAALDEDDSMPDKSDPVVRLLLVLGNRDHATERVLRSFVDKVPEAAFDYTRDEIARSGGGSGKAVRILQRIEREGVLTSPNDGEPERAGNGADPATWPERYIAASYRLPDDELEFNLAEHGVTAEEIVGHIAHAYELRTSGAA